MMSKFFFIDCDKATTICNKNQYKEASLWEIVKMNIHVLICKTCGRYSKQNATVTKICNKHLQKIENTHKLCEEEKQMLQNEVVKRINSK